MRKRIVVSSFALLLFVALFLWTLLDPKGYLKGGDFTYLIALFLSLGVFLWGMSMVYRVQYRTQRRLILSLFILFYVWMTMRFLKWLPNIHYLSIYVDYSYYIPMMGVPVLFLALIGETVLPTWKKRYIIYAIASTIATVFVVVSLTNDFHHLIYQNMTFAYAEDNPNIEIISYSYGLTHYIAMGYIALLAISSFALFAIAKRKQSSFRQIVLPLSVLLVIIAYSLLYLFESPFVRQAPLLKDFALMMTLLLSALLEVLLLVGLIQNKGRYGTRFRHSPIPMRIYDETGFPAYSSADFNEEAYKRKDPDFLYKERPIGDYLLVVEESIKEIAEVKAKIEKKNKDIADINALLESTIAITAEKPSLSYRLELVDEIEANLREEDRQARQLIRQLPDIIDDTNKTKTLQTLGRIALLLGYMKQKCMLLLELKRHDAMSSDAFRLLLHVITKDVSSVGINEASFTLNGEENVRMSFAFLVNELINKVAYACAFKASYLMVIVDASKEKAVLEIDADIAGDIPVIKGAKIRVKNEDALRVNLEVER